MRKTLAALVAVAVAASVAAFAGTASADVANPSIGTYADPPGTPHAAYGHSCTTPLDYGQIGSWGCYIDGCTAPSSGIRCMVSSCWVSSGSTIAESPYYGHQTTQNARIRVFNSAGQLKWFHDRSCAGVNTCSTSDGGWISYGDMVTEQCNGVREATRLLPLNRSSNYCWYRIYN
jgi:hypothetical protein